MKRVLVVLFALCAGTAFVLTQGGAGEEERDNRYTVEFDNAFGLVVGGDLKIAGVRAGTITDMDVDRRTKRALVEFEITKEGFGSLRTDVFCESRPQSLIGEYFIDCQPGTDREVLKPGSKIAVERTASTVPPDLVNNIMREPYRDRLRIILGELGVGLGARGEQLNDAIRRASPALRETNRVLEILGRQNQLLADLVRDGDQVIGELAHNKRDVARWVRETGETARASAERREAIAASLERLPEFLRELEPTMAELGRAADEQTPTLVDLRASASELERLFTQLEPFAKASQVNLRSLAEASGPGRRAVEAAGPTVTELERFSEQAPEVSKNLSIVLRHLDDREASAVEPDPRSPGGEGYTGLEAILQYVFDQTMAINIFDRNGYILKVNLHEGKCAEFQNGESLLEEEKKHPGFIEDCAATLGPNQPGLNQPDPTDGAFPDEGENRNSPERRAAEAPAGAGEKGAGDRAEPGAKRDAPPVNLRETLEDLLGPLGNVKPQDIVPKDKLDELRERLKREREKLPEPTAPTAPTAPSAPTAPAPTDQSAADALADFLFGS